MVGQSTDLATTVNGLIDRPGDDLARALTHARPRRGLAGRTPRRSTTIACGPPASASACSPARGSTAPSASAPCSAHRGSPPSTTPSRSRTRAAFGLTGGIQSLDPAEVDEWIARVEVGNAYVNRSITGAIVQRQPFGGWKRSSVGPGAKAGGPNYVRQLGRWIPTMRSRARRPRRLARGRHRRRRALVGRRVRRRPRPDRRCSASRTSSATARCRRWCSACRARCPVAHVERVRAAARRCGVPFDESWARRRGRRCTSPAGSADSGVARVRVLGDGRRRRADRGQRCRRAPRRRPGHRERPGRAGPLPPRAVGERDPPPVRQPRRSPLSRPTARRQATSTPPMASSSRPLARVISGAGPVAEAVGERTGRRREAGVPDRRCQRRCRRRTRPARPACGCRQAGRGRGRARPRG